MVIEHFLEGDQVIGQDFIGGIEGNCLGYTVASRATAWAIFSA
jgi:hypothetical protein